MFMIKKRNFICFSIMVFIVGAAVPVAAISAVRAIRGETPISQSDYAEYRAFKSKYGKLLAFDAYIRDNYYLPVDQGMLETGAYKGQFAGLGDIYTAYYTADEYRLQSENAQGEFSGIGAALRKNDGENPLIDSVLPGGPAEKEGLLAGDAITLIDGAPCADASLAEAVERLRGEEGTTVALMIRREGAEFEKTLTRAKVVSPSVAGEMIEDGRLGYIRIASFASHTAEDFRTALDGMESGGAAGLVIDLRDNSGGLVDSGVEIADMLLDGGTVAVAKAGDGSEEAYVTSPGATGLPYVLLVNGGSASTSEILAGAVQDNRGGALVGARTTGKGIIQRLERFSGGDGARITVAQYFRPNGDPVHEVGITPDYTVERADGDEADPQLAKAVELLLPPAPPVQAEGS
ncbi:MAG: S41 family peptidase [Clostridiales Family XIII bacterium]|jgi:carboxyl-terminal processing protease|nr:S41 family peptidase [Clostridiales Family XIII bacterium]